MKTILVLTDFSEKAEHAAEVALDIAIKARANLLLFNAFVPHERRSSFNWPLEEYFMLEDECCTQLHEVTSRLNRQLPDQNTADFKPQIKYFSCMGDVGSNIRDVVLDKEIWLIVMGSRNKENALENFFFGSSTTQVIDKAGCPVLIVPEKANLADVRKIALALDLETRSTNAIKFVAELAKTFKAQLFLTHVSTSGVFDMQEESVEIKVKSPLKLPSIYYNELKGELIEKELQDFSDEHQIDILVVVHKKADLFTKIFGGSTTKKLLKDQHMALLVFPEPHPEN